MARSPIGRRALRAAFAALAALAVHSAVVPPPAALAQTQDEIKQARELAKDAFAAYKANDYKKALVLFDQARKLYPSAQILRMTGYSYLALEQWDKAADFMDQALVSTVGAALEADDKKDVAEQLARAMAHLGYVNVTSTVAGAELGVDDKTTYKLPLDKPIRLLAGKHKLTVRAPEHKDATEEVNVEPNGKTADVKLNPTPIPKVEDKPPPPPPPKPPPPPPPPPKGWVPAQLQIGLVAGGAGLAVGAVAVVTGLGSLHLTEQVKSDIQRHNDSYGANCEKVSSAYYRDCYFDTVVINHDSDRANELATWSLGTAIAGGVLIAGGLTLVLFAPEGPLGPKAKPQPKDATGDDSAPRPKAKSGVTAACAPLLTGGVTCGGTF